MVVAYHEYRLEAHTLLSNVPLILEVHFCGGSHVTDGTHMLLLKPKLVVYHQQQTVVPTELRM